MAVQVHSCGLGAREPRGLASDKSQGWIRLGPGATMVASAGWCPPGAAGASQEHSNGSGIRSQCLGWCLACLWPQMPGLTALVGILSSLERKDLGSRF